MILTTCSVLLSLFCSTNKMTSAFVIHHRNTISYTNTLKAATKAPQENDNVIDTSQIEGNIHTDEVLETLKKRLKDGNLSPDEIQSLIDASDNLMEELDALESKNSPKYDNDQLRTAVSQMDLDAVDEMVKAGLVMDEETVDTAFWSVVHAVDTSEEQDLPLSGDVSRMIHHIFDADMHHLLQREKISTNVTCMQPDDTLGDEGAARRMNYVFDDGDHKNLPLMEGRRCEGGNCCDKCSRNIFPTFAQDHETNFDKFPSINSLTFNDLEKIPSATIIQFVRLIERVRRTIAHEYGLPLSTILPLQAYSRKYVAGSIQKGGGGGEGDFVTLHTDEATHAGYHYSCVLYLSTQGEDFEGGNFVFNDPAKTTGEENANISEYSEEVDDALLESIKNGELPDELILGGEDAEDDSTMSLEEEIRRAGRELSAFHPTRGSGVIFSSGWENMHEVEKITSGVRYAVPCFFTTCPVPDIAYDQMKVGKPKCDEDIADDWLHLLLAHQKEDPMSSVGRVKELLMKWHYICTPLSEH